MSHVLELLRSWKEMILRAPKHLLTIKDWRHHHLGLLQGYLDENTRVHVWHPDLVDPDLSGDPLRGVHDHRYDIRSEILYGVVEDVSYEVWPLAHIRHTKGLEVLGPVEPLGEPQETNLFSIVNAKKQKAENKASDNVAEERGRVWVRETGRRRYHTGDTYAIPRRAFHTSIPVCLAVTLIVRSNYDDFPARVLGHVAKSGMTFGLTDERELILGTAIHALSNMPNG